MAEKKELFKCSKCGAYYLTEEEATVCEGKHVDIVKLSAVEYLTEKKGDTKYAERIYIEYSDGRVMQYEATKIGLKTFNG